MRFRYVSSIRIEANVRTLQVTVAWGMLVPSKLYNGLQTPPRYGYEANVRTLRVTKAFRIIVTSKFTNNSKCGL